MRIWLTRRFATWQIVASVFVVSFVGCSSENRVATGTVTGVVTYNGDPLQIGSLLFVPVGGGPTAEANIGTDGSFEMGTYDDDDGAVLGEHQVMITAFTAPGGSGLPEDVIDGDGAPVSILPDFYGDLEKSGLKVDVKSGENNIDFVLTSKSGEVRVK
jgi:hypothetical protein